MTKFLALALTLCMSLPAVAVPTPAPSPTPEYQFDLVWVRAKERGPFRLSPGWEVVSVSYTDGRDTAVVLIRKRIK